MADANTNTTTPAPTPAATAKAKTVLDDMPSRAVKPNTEEAIAYIMNAAQTYSDFGNMTIIAPMDAKRGVSGLGQDENGALVFDSELFPESMDIHIAVLTERGEGAGSSAVKAIVVYPTPRLDDILANDTGRKWVADRIETELNRVAVRGLRAKDADMQSIELLDSMPKSLADYVTSNRGGGSTLLQAFEEFWRPIKTGLGKLSKAWRLANLSKKELKNAMSSKAYAEQYYPTLESVRGKDKDGNATVVSLFVLALQTFILEAKKAGMDSALFDQWLASRDTHTISDSDAEDDDEVLSLEGLSALMAAPAPEAEDEAASAGESEGEQPETVDETEAEPTA